MTTEKNNQVRGKISLSNQCEVKLKNYVLVKNNIRKQHPARICCAATLRGLHGEIPEGRQRGRSKQALGSC